MTDTTLRPVLYLPLLLIATIPLTATPLGPGPPNCTPGSLASYDALGSVGCLLDSEVGVYDFNLSVISGQITAENITVTPSSGFYSAQLNFTSPNFFAEAGSTLKFVISYNIDPHPILWEMSDAMDVSSPVAPGSASIVTLVCVGANFTPGCATTTFTLTTLHNGTPVKLTDSIGFPATSLLGVQNTFTLDGGPANGGGSSNINGLRNGLSEMPEPATAPLLAGVLSALGFWRFRSRRRAARP